MDIIRRITIDAYNYIMDIDKWRWANAFVEGCQYDMLTTNLTESTNILLKEIRELPITTLVEAIQHRLMQFYETRRNLAQLLQTPVTPYAEKILADETERARYLQCDPAGAMEF